MERRVLGGAGCSAQQSKARRAELGFCGGCGGEDGSREATGGLYKAAANLGVRARVGKPARTTARIGPVVALVGRKELTGWAWFVGDG